jgi:hypothetical protein
MPTAGSSFMASPIRTPVMGMAQRKVPVAGQSRASVKPAQVGGIIGEKGVLVFAAFYLRFLKRP